MNTVFDYGRMADDCPRVKAYIEAMRSAITPGARVLDIGCGVGIFSVLAAKLGASEVIGVEPCPAIEHAPRLAKANGVGGVVTFVRGYSTDLNLDDPVDVIVSDLRGGLPLYKRNLPSIKDAQRRLLRESGCIIPSYDTIHAAPVSHSRVAEMIRRPWEENGLGLDLSLIAEIERSRLWRTRVAPSDVLSAPKVWAEIDYAKIDKYDFSRNLTWVLDKSSRVSGIALWFDGQLTSTVGFSNSPYSEACIYGHTVIPLKETLCEAGDTITAAISAKLLAENYIWAWVIRIQKPDRTEVTTTSRNTMPLSNFKNILNLSRQRRGDGSVHESSR